MTIAWRCLATVWLFRRYIWWNTNSSDLSHQTLPTLFTHSPHYSLGTRTNRKSRADHGNGDSDYRIPLYPSGHGCSPGNGRIVRMPPTTIRPISSPFYSQRRAIHMVVWPSSRLSLSKEWKARMEKRRSSSGRERRIYWRSDVRNRFLGMFLCGGWGHPCSIEWCSLSSSDRTVMLNLATTLDYCNNQYCPLS